ncbi:uncharacterized protein [Periplaneta americana]|uniref:uncharacterized protein n=1 Tax=Periplaneta americana TaxID=6978 RepID=UPI0037E7B8DD
MLPMPGNWRWSVSGFNMSPVNIRHAVLHYPKWWEALGRATCVSSTGIRTGTELPTLSKIGSRHVDVEQDIGSKGESGAVTVCHLLRRRGIMGISPSNNQIQTTDCQRSLGSIVSMIPWLKRGSLQGLELPRVVSEKCSRFFDMFSEGKYVCRFGCV